MTFKEGLLIGGGSLLVYYLLLSPSHRKALETWANTHHFEYALGIGGLGVLKNDTTMLGIATVFGIHDWKDKDIAIQNFKNKLSTLNSFLELIRDNAKPHQSLINI